MVLIPIDPKKVKVGRKCMISTAIKHTEDCDCYPYDVKIVAITKRGYKVMVMCSERVLPKLRKVADLWVRRPY